MYNNYYYLGHLVFEMSCGYELTMLCPDAKTYESIRDPEIKEILQFILKDGFPNGLEQVIIR